MSILTNQQPTAYSQRVPAPKNCMQYVHVIDEDSPSPLETQFVNSGYVREHESYLHSLPQTNYSFMNSVPGLDQKPHVLAFPEEASSNTFVPPAQVEIQELEKDEATLKEALQSVQELANDQSLPVEVTSQCSSLFPELNKWVGERKFKHGSIASAVVLFSALGLRTIAVHFKLSRSIASELTEASERLEKIRVELIPKLWAFILYLEEEDFVIYENETERPEMLQKKIDAFSQDIEEVNNEIAHVLVMTKGTTRAWKINHEFDFLSCSISACLGVLGIAVGYAFPPASLIANTGAVASLINSTWSARNMKERTQKLKEAEEFLEEAEHLKHQASLIHKVTQRYSVEKRRREDEGNDYESCKRARRI